MHKTFVHDKAPIPPHRDSTEVFEPRMGSLHFPTPSIPPKFATVFIRTVHPVVTIRGDQFDSHGRKLFSQSVVVITLVGHHSNRSQPSRFSPTLVMLFLFNSIDRFFRNMTFISRCTFHFRVQRSPIAIDDRHNHRTLSRLCFSDIFAPFFAGTNVPSKNVSSSRSLPASSSNASKCWWTAPRIPCSSHSIKRRRQVLQDGKFLGICSHGHPARQNQIRASKVRRVFARGLPPSGPMTWTGKTASIRFQSASSSFQATFFPRFV